MKATICYDYSPFLCDLCGSDASKVVINKPSPPSILSDNKKAEVNLYKVECNTCGLVRDAHEISAEGLNKLYQFDYTLNKYTAEYHFLTSRGSIPRSQAFFDWIWRHLKGADPENLRQVLEVGSGAGHLLKRLQDSLPHAVCFGTELSDMARQQASKNGCRVIAGGIEQVSESEIDLIVAVGVLEHVPRPTRFLEAILKRLSGDGILILIQPTQDVLSSDIYFSDHLHHFATDHLRMYAKMVGFAELTREVGHPLMPNFSFHMWRRAEPSADFVGWGGTRCRDSVSYYEALFQRVNQLVGELEADPSRKLAVFGLNEQFAMFDAYSKLAGAAIQCGLSDVEPYVEVAFPVIKPEQAKEFQITDVLLCVNQIHYDYVRERLMPLGVKVHLFN